MHLSSIASIIFQITYKTQNLVKCQGPLRIKTQSIRKIDRKIYQTKHLSTHSPSKASTFKMGFKEEEPALIHVIQAKQELA